MAHISSLPDEIHVEIFKYIHCKDRCCLSRVCKRWKKLLSTPCLWRHVDLYPYPLKLSQVWKVMRAHFTVAVQHIRIRGFVKKFSSRPAYSTPVVSESMLLSLGKRCPNLRTLILEECYFYNSHVGVCLAHFPSSLESLSFESSIFSKASDWFSNCKLRVNTVLPNLLELDISGCNLPGYSVSQIPKLFPKLEKFSLRRCFRVSNNTLHLTLNSLKCLVSLDIRGIIANNATMLIISRHGYRLQELYVSSRSVDSEGLDCFSERLLPDLKRLYISECDIDDIGLNVIIQKGIKLTELDVTKTLVTLDGIKIFKKTFPNCKVFSSFEDHDCLD